MILSLNWLKDFIDIDMSPDELSHLLTMGGLEVDSIKTLGKPIDNIIVAKILSVKKHPNADRLTICQVDTGKDNVPVVCGAPNVKEGMFVPMALPGAIMPGGFEIKESKLRGELSMGMLLAEDELGLTDDHSGIMVLPDIFEVGSSFCSAMSLEDHAFEISLTPNRPDCASVIGIAKEIAAYTGQKIKMPDITYKESDVSVNDLASVEIKDVSACPRYSAAVIQDVKIGRSPFWLRYRLFASGVRSLNNVVDITNYVLMEMGQPLHSFDYDLLKGHKIVVQRANADDIFTTLDEKTHILNEDNLMICDGEQPVALAGVMGGLNSEISNDSVNVLLESAFFDPVTIRRGSKRLGLSTESSYRFERGVDIDGVITASKRALMLISDMAGGKIAKGMIDEYSSPYIPPAIDLRVSKTNNFLGTDISKETMSGYLKSLDMKVNESDNDTLKVEPPSFRIDISREADLIEEVARLEGYDNIPTTIPTIRPFEDGQSLDLQLQGQISEILAGLGYSESITFSFISPDSIDALGVGDDSPLRSYVKLQNPLTVDQSVMRTSLLPGLLSTVKTNISHGETDLKIFEWGKIFTEIDNSKLPDENYSLSAIITGSYSSKEWHNESREVDFYDIKGAVEVLLDSLGINDVSYVRRELSSYYDPLVSCGVCADDLLLGSFGQLSSDVIKKNDIRAKNIYIFELDVSSLIKAIRKRAKKYEFFTNFPVVLRDISLVVDRKIESAGIVDTIENVGGDLVESVNIFDLYEGENIGRYKKAISFRICYRAKDRTLDGKEINQLHEKIIEQIRKETNGTLREG